MPGIGPVPQVTSEWPYRNPLFTFALFAEGGDFSLEDVEDAYRGVPWSYVPNILCFLDRGIVTLCHSHVDGSGSRSAGAMVLVPEFAKVEPGEEYVWALWPMGEPDRREAANLAVLEWSILAHLDGVALMPSKPSVLHAYLTGKGLTAAQHVETLPAEHPPAQGSPDLDRH